MEKTKIEWTDRTIQLVRGCTEISRGCVDCYASRMAHQLAHGHGVKPVAAYEGFTKETQWGPQWSGKIALIEANLTSPLRWRKPQSCFVCSMSDLFHDEVPELFIRAWWLVMANRPDCEFQILTKRVTRMASMLAKDEFWIVDAELAQYAQQQRIPIADMRKARTWLGTSASDAKTWNARKGNLRWLKAQTGSPVFASLEPLLGSVDMRPDEDWSWLNLAIVGGQSGYQYARPMHPRWPRQIRNVCQQQGVAFFFKQWGNWKFIEDYFDGRELQAGEQIVRDEGGSHVSAVVMAKVRNKRSITNTLDGKLHQDFPKWPEVQHAG